MDAKSEKNRECCRRAADVLKVRGEDLLRTLATVIGRGNASRIVVRSGTTVVADMPVTVAVVSAVMAPWVTLLATIALLVSTWTLEVERPASRREPVVP
jgi:Na+-driven multidrug efflux pump